MTDQNRLALAHEIAHAARSVEQVLLGHTLPEEPLALDSQRRAAVPGKSRAAIRDMAYQTIRRLGRLREILGKLNRKTPQPSVLALQLVALEQIVWPMREVHVVVDQAVSAARLMSATRPAGGLINAVLRRFLREQAVLINSTGKIPEARWNFPRWWIEQLQKQYPTRWQQVLEISDQPGPLTLRVNALQTSVEKYLAQLESVGLSGQAIGPLAVRLEQAVDVQRLPGFESGMVSVQDAGAQLAAPLLNVQAGDRVLDACAAPGGKTAHILEQRIAAHNPNEADPASAPLLALDSDASRLDRVAQNLDRLGLSDHAVCRVGDAARPADWWDGQPFDRILVDAPCTASGIVRRHPEIRWLRQRRDIETLGAIQTKILAGLWPTLKPGGKLLYVTCSVFCAEGEGVANHFLNAEPTARRVPLMGCLGLSGDVSPIDQLLPHQGPRLDHDGFFYALIEKLV
ncbi:MAG: 16S rRNA (cytosine(967)-C(5))-methyltransferase RsmB [Burkholderiaceae bacterium]